MARRSLVKGGSGSGKSTLGGALARHLDLPYVELELDALHHGPNWTAASSELLRERILQRIDDARGWVVDGNYESKLGTGSRISMRVLMTKTVAPLRTGARASTR